MPPLLGRGPGREPSRRPELPARPTLPQFTRRATVPKVVDDQQISDDSREGPEMKTSAANSADPARTSSIADRYEDLLATLDDGPRRGLVHRLSVGYYEGWRPSREEVANLIARETGRITEGEYLQRRRNHAPSSVSRANHMTDR